MMKRGVATRYCSNIVEMKPFVRPIAQFAARSKDGDVLSASSSGGVFTELARVVLRRGGIIVGAGFETGSFRVVHECIDSEVDIGKLRGSKYVTSDMSLVYKPIQRYLSENRMVLFVGCPCQVAAIRHVFGTSENLLLCAIMCHGNIPADIWRRYLDEVQARAGSRLLSVSFRGKQQGWRQGLMEVTFEDPSKNFSMPWYGNPYGKLFLSGWALRESCLHCQFRGGRSGADLMIGDFWGIEAVDKNLDDDAGVSAVLVYSGKGADLLKEAKCYLLPVAYDQVILKNPNVEISPTVDLPKRKRFLSIYRNVKFSRALRYAEYGNVLREICIKTRMSVHGFIRNLSRKGGLK